MPKNALTLLLSAAVFSLAAAIGAHASISAPAKDQTGLELRDIEPGSIYEKLGLKNGDVLVDFNGQPFRTSDDIARFVERLRNDSRVQLTVRRRGEIKVFRYTLK